MNFSTIIEHAMIDAGIKKRGELAEKMGVANTTVSDLLNGKIRWNEDNMKAAATALGCELAFTLRKTNAG